jgi:hypothetical protein
MKVHIGNPGLLGHGNLQICNIAFDVIVSYTKLMTRDVQRDHKMIMRNTKTPNTELWMTKGKP